jgi:hypothetical protein
MGRQRRGNACPTRQRHQIAGYRGTTTHAPTVQIATVLVIVFGLQKIGDGGCDAAQILLPEITVLVGDVARLRHSRWRQPVILKC